FVQYIEFSRYITPFGCGKFEYLIISNNHIYAYALKKLSTSIFVHSEPPVICSHNVLVLGTTTNQG
ncbi:MAG: hypothetical protein ABS939_23900, partial [Psychrobacillus sp.]